jgi:hypothetical protein
MNNLLAIEWLKIKKYRTFWILMGLFFLLLPLFNYMISSGLLHLGGRKNGFNVLSTVYSFPGVWSSMGFWGSIFINFMAILVIIITTNEFEFRTNRQNIIDGWERMDFLNGKILIVLLLSLVVTLYVFLTGLVFGRVTGGSFNGAFSGIAQVGYFFILSLDYMGFGLLLALLIRKSGLAIGLFLLYSLIIENIIVGSVNHFTNKPWGNLVMLQSSDELLPFPMMKMAQTMMGSDPAISMSIYAVVACAWCAVYYFIARAVLLRKDW